MCGRHRMKSIAKPLSTFNITLCYDFPSGRLDRQCFVVVRSLSRVRLCDPWTAAYQASLSFTICWSLLRLMSIEPVMPSNHFILCCPLLLPPSIFPASGSFPMSGLFASGGQSIGTSVSVSILSMNIQDWFPLGWTGWISLQSKRLSRVFSNTTVQNHQFFTTQTSSRSNFHIIHDNWKNHSFNYMDLCHLFARCIGKNDVHENAWENIG